MGKYENNENNTRNNEKKTKSEETANTQEQKPDRKIYQINEEKNNTMFIRLSFLFLSTKEMCCKKQL